MLLLNLLKRIPVNLFVNFANRLPCAFAVSETSDEECLFFARIVRHSER